MAGCRAGVLRIPPSPSDGMSNRFTVIPPYLPHRNPRDTESSQIRGTFLQESELWELLLSWGQLVLEHRDGEVVLLLLLGAKGLEPLGAEG